MSSLYRRSHERPCLVPEFGFRVRTGTGVYPARICDEFGLDQEQIRNGSRRRPVAQARVRIIDELINRHGVSLTEVAGLVGISTSGVGNALHRLEGNR
jgi:hypothetical protein